MRAGIWCCNHLFRRQRRPIIARRSIRRPRAERLNLRHEGRLTRRGTLLRPSSRRQRRPTVGSHHAQRGGASPIDLTLEHAGVQVFDHRRYGACTKAPARADDDLAIVLPPASGASQGARTAEGCQGRQMS